MSGGMYVIVRCVLIFIDVVSIAMLGRAVLSWFTMGEQTRIGAFLYVVTEPIILPVRGLCNRFGWFQGLPMDMPFLITSMLMMLVTVFLRAALMA
jgi:uncharacterized protein YggT (Ycf19 family)